MDQTGLLQSLPALWRNRALAVDILLFEAELKQAVRCKCDSIFELDTIADWATAKSLALVSDDLGYCVIANDLNTAKFIMSMDSLPASHELELGLLLGYPRCCCAFAGEIGESALDEYEIIVRKWSFTEEWKLIDPTRYSIGESLISHLPCDVNCFSSLNVARKAHTHIQRNRYNEFFGNWCRFGTIEICQLD